MDGSHFKVVGRNDADKHFFDVFSYELLRGDISDPLGKPNSVVLTESTARQLFGDDDPVGRTVTLSARTDYTVSAIAADPPDATYLKFHVVYALQSRAETVRWGGLASGIFVKIAKGASIAQFEQKLNDLLREAAAQQWERGNRFRVEPLTRIHLYSKARNRFAPSSDIRYLYLFGGIGLLILLMASINYMNLATARSARRAKEVGVRKVVGATRKQLAKQFLGESFLLSLLALPPAVFLAFISLPMVNSVTGQQLNLGMANHAMVWIGVLGLLGLIAVVGGSYPSFILSSFRPASVFKGGTTLGRQHGVIRKLLVGIQVVATFTLVMGTLLFKSQMDFVRSKRLGFDQSQVVTLGSIYDWDEASFRAFKTLVESDPSIVRLSSGGPLGLGQRDAWGSYPIVNEGPEFEVVSFQVGRDYVETLGLDLLDGRSFSEVSPEGPATSVIVTESFVKALEWTENPIGHTMTISRDTVQIQGVVADIQNRSLRLTSSTSGPNPLFVFEFTEFPQQWIKRAVARLAPGRTAEGLSALEVAWNQFSPVRPFEFEFLDDQIQQQYTSERRLANIFGVFAGLSIFVACLGLFGLAAFTAEQRTKEIGIRKALGATVKGVVLLLSRDYVGIVFAGVIVATPVVFILGNRWLENFADHIEIGSGLILSATAAVLGFVLLAVTYQSIKAALANPTDALRHD